MKKQIDQKKNAKNCQFHSFSLKPLVDQVYYKKSTSATFCSKLNKNNQCIENLYPTFNQDGLYYTPAFILPIDKIYYKQNDMKLIREHQEKVKQYTQTNIIIYEPKPGKKYKYCAVCRNNYEDYLQHIRSNSHKKNINSSKYNSLILNTCQNLFNNVNENKNLQVKTKKKHTLKQKKKNPQIVLDDQQKLQPIIKKKNKSDQQKQIQYPNTKPPPPYNFNENQFYFWNMLQNFYNCQRQIGTNPLINQGFFNSYQQMNYYFSNYYRQEQQRCKQRVREGGLMKQPIIIIQE